jgi:DNA-directed RNA polymerase specialized sigma24 family protein
MVVTESLVDALRAGDSAAQVQLWQRCRYMSGAAVRRRVLRAQDADDVATDTYLAARASVHAIRDPRAFWGFLKVIHRRQCGRLFRRPQTLALPHALVDPAPPPDHAILARERAALVRGAVERIRPFYRPVLTRLLDGLEDPAIRAALDLTPTKYRNRKHRAIRALTNEVQ